MIFTTQMIRKFFNILTILLLVFALPTAAQDVTDPDETSSVADTSALSALRADTLMLPWPQAMQASLDQLVQSNMFTTSHLGLMVYDLDADSTLYAFNEKKLMRPASTMKLITAITAIDRLGGSYQFKTDLCYKGTIDNRVLNGDIYCVGGFDPRFNTDDMRAFVEAIRKMGVDTIRGHIYADKSMKDDVQYGEGWCWDDDNPVLSPLLISKKDMFIDKFVEGLVGVGIVVDAQMGNARRPADAYTICHRFHTIDQVLLRMLKESDNLYAESMFYQLGASTGTHPATAKSARKIVCNLIQKLGFNPSSYAIADGSGLSLYNYLSAELEVAMLRYAYKNNDILMHLRPSLPIAATDGTLRRRMNGTFTNGNVRAKTGTVTGVSALAGYCVAANGHHLAFSIINNGLRHTRNGRAFQDQVCTVLCRP